MRARNFRSRQNAAFTLIEIMVVVAIILILVRILMPAVKGVRDQAKAAQCASNLHQLGIAFKMYTQDYNNYYPKSGTTQTLSDWVHAQGDPNNGGTPPTPSCAPIGTVQGKAYETALGKYANPSDPQQHVKTWLWPDCTKTVYWCSADEHNNKKSSSGGFVDWATSYRMNNSLSLLSSNVVQYPTGTYLLLEEAEDGSANTDGAFVPGGTKHAADRHHGGSNALYCDGHVKWSNKGNTSTPGTFEYDSNPTAGYGFALAGPQATTY